MIRAFIEDNGHEDNAAESNEILSHDVNDLSNETARMSFFKEKKKKKRSR